MSARRFAQLVKQCPAFGIAVLLWILPCKAAIHEVPLGIPTIQEALDVAVVGDTIYVDPGTYTGPLNKNLDFMGKDLVLIGTAGSAATIIDCEFDGNGMNLVNGETEATLVQGFTIKHGYLGEWGHGGGILCYCDARFVDLVLLENSAEHGGGLLVSYLGSPTIENAVFDGNIARNFGAGGGAVLSYESRAVFRDVLFRANEGSYGGGMEIAGGGCMVTLENVTFENNHARDWGGGLYCNDVALLQDCVFTGNFAQNDGGGLSTGGHVELDNCIFVGNTAADAGGAIRAVRDNGSIIQNTLIIDNTAAVGGGLFASEFTDSADMRLRNVTFAGNTSLWNAGGAICAIWQAEVDLAECLVTGNLSGGAFFTDQGGAIHTACNNVFDNVGGNYTGNMEDQTGINGNISADPFLCEPPGSEYHVADLSPCLPENNDCGVLMGRYGQGCMLTAAPPEILPGLRLEQNHPNPFNPRTEIRFALPAVAPMSLVVFDLAGRLVKELIRSESYPSGDHTVTWNGRDETGKPVSSGVYLYRLETGSRCETGKMTLLR